MQPGPARRLPGRRWRPPASRCDDELIQQGDFYHESGFAGGAALLDLPDPPTAIFASSDQMALGVYEAVRRRGLRVPDDVSVVGFDDLPEARWSLAAADHGPPAAGRDGRAGRAHRAAAGPGRGHREPRVELATELVVRDSTAPPK